ncbi:MAG: hypothetical protein JWP68_1945 [Modestobacter sp.]|nr:hypothetical protein [Modestobacter sp.]
MMSVTSTEVRPRGPYEPLRQRKPAAPRLVSIIRAALDLPPTSCSAATGSGS